MASHSACLYSHRMTLVPLGLFSLPISASGVNLIFIMITNEWTLTLPFQKYPCDNLCGPNTCSCGSAKSLLKCSISETWIWWRWSDDNSNRNSQIIFIVDERERFTDQWCKSNAFLTHVVSFICRSVWSYDVRSLETTRQQSANWFSDISSFSFSPVSVCQCSGGNALSRRENVM